MEIKIGLKAEFEIIVSPKDTAAQYGSGSLNVFATPAMITLMEKTVMMCIAEQLEIGRNSVGTEINVKHIKATKVGEAVLCVAELIEIDRSKLIFTVEAFDNEGLIGHGTHKRFLIDEKQFMAKLNREN
ncbi:MAG: thioesterase family protein [Bacteroidales bacterium]|jgi:fluoroacetyl-CoA thioesterase|nr:thioesterase family protein [Bacteroidales bacterium]